MSPEQRRIVMRARPFTMTSLERIAALIQAVEYTVKNKIPGAFVECGVWKGGSSMAAALTYLELGKTDVDLFLFDTFMGLPPPGDEDFHAGTGRTAAELVSKSAKGGEMSCYASIGETRRNLESTTYPPQNLHLVQGMVEETIPLHAPEQISILRLDTDWYSSTKHELIHLFPLLSKNGVLIIDDYGHWTGARKAVDEYFTNETLKPLLNRIDQSGRSCIKV
jgi:O-methyltransferase